MVAAGDTLGSRYRLDERIAAGGMGTVFTATDEKLGRTVAIKLLRDSLADDARFVERFRREARSAASLSHPNIAGVYDYGKDGACHFIVMEYAPGRDLARLLRDEGPLDPGRAVGIAAQVGEALAAAHDVKMVHRDVKPGNILVDQNDNVKVTDFGIARASGDSTLTATGSILGSAHYLSPEQASGGKIEPSSDVYSLGIVLYEMLTNTVPFTGDSAVAVAMRHLEDTVPMPSSLRPDVPPEIDALVRGATENDPARRYADGREFAEAARASSTGEVTAPIAAAVSPRGDARTAVIPVTPLNERWDPQRVGKAVVALFIGLMALAVVLAIFRAINAPPLTPSGARASLSPGNSEAPEEVTLPAGLIGRPADDVEAELDGLGFVATSVPDPGSDLDEGLTTRIDPPEGDTVEPGSEVTVYFSPGEDPEDEDDDEEDDEKEDDEKDPPEHSKGKGKDKEKD